MALTILLYIFISILLFSLVLLFAIKINLDGFLYEIKSSNTIALIIAVLGMLFIIWAFISPSIISDNIIKSKVEQSLLNDSLTELKNAQSTDILTRKGQTGDYIGGLMNPFIAIAGVIFTALAFYMQFLANNEIKEQFKIQQFESKFYEMIRLHKENVNEMNIDDKFIGRKVFVPMFDELQNAFKLVTHACNNLGGPKISFTDEEKLRLAYSIYFYGVGKNSEKNYYKRLSPYTAKIFDATKILIESIQDEVKRELGKNKSKKNIKVEIPNKDLALRFSYFPFYGHLNRIAHYYRHIFQTVTFIDSQTSSKINKMDYMRMYRAQLSSYEQLLLYYNAMAWFDEEWKRFFVEYRFIKNLPLGLADFGVLPLEHFKAEIEKLEKKGKKLFELQ